MFARMIAMTLLLTGQSIASAGTLNCNLRSDSNEVSMPNVPKPAYLVPFTDPVFGTKITRVTGDPGTAISSGGTWGADAHHQYSKIQAFNADQSLLFIETNREGGSTGVFLDGNTYKPVLSANCPAKECLWHPKDPNLMITVTSNSVGTWNPRTGAKTTIATFSGYSDFTFGQYEGNLSLDGKMVALDGYNPSGKFVTFAYDLVNKVKYPDIDFNQWGTNPGAGQISPKGNYIMQGYEDENSGNAVTDLYGNLILSLPHGIPDHYDLTVDANGDEVAVGSARTSGYYGRIVKVRLRDGQITPLTFYGGYGSHTSTRGWNILNWGVSNIFSDSSGFKNEIFTYNLDGSKVYRLAHDHNPNPDYEAETHPMQSPDGLRIVFASSWSTSTRPVSVYVIDLRPNCTTSTTADVSAPSVPAGLSAQAVSSSQINLSRNASSDNVGVAGYTVMRNGAAIANVTGTSYSNTGLSASTTYSYSVVAYDAAGNRSAQSATASATTQAVTPPPPPPPSGNLLVNSGFENGLTGWTVWANSIIVSPGYAGSRALRVGKGTGGVYQDVTSKLVVGGTYTYSFYAKLGSRYDQATEIGVEFFDAGGKVIFDRHLKITSTKYSKGSVTFTYPSGVRSALIYVYKGNGSSYLYADALSLVKN